MNCKDIQAAIDSASRRSPLSQLASAHLAGCPDCHRYSDQANSLLALLSAQPRVEAPADFEFRLRARIARAEAKPTSPFAFVENFFGQVFSFKQAAASLAALAMMAAGTTLYVVNIGQPVMNKAVVARNEAPASPVRVETPVAPTAGNSVDSPKPMAVKYARVKATTMPATLSESPAREVNIASNTTRKEDTIRLYNRERGQVIEAPVRTTVYGVESAVAMAKPAAYAAGF